MVLRKVLLILPALNEENALKKLAGEVPANFDVLVVDSGSSDGTVQVAKDSGFRVLPVKYGRGQGSGIRTGLEYFLEGDYDLIITADCDYSDILSGLPNVAEFQQASGLDLVLGVRDFRKQREYLGMTTMVVKKVVSIFIYALTGLEIRDLLTGVWSFNRRAVAKIQPRLGCIGFEYSFEIFSVAWMEGLRIGQTDIGFRRRIGTTKLTLAKRFWMVFLGLKYGCKLWVWRLFGPGRKEE